jgi:hypothetical protein
MLRLQQRLLRQSVFHSGIELDALVLHPTLLENVYSSSLPPASTPTIRRQCFSAQFVRRYHKDTAWFWIRHVYDSKISPCISLPDGYSRSFFALTILTWSCQYFLHFVLNDIVIVDMR